MKGQTIHLIRMTILHILATLGPNDYMNAVWYNVRREYALRGCSDGFLPATTVNKKVKCLHFCDLLNEFLKSELFLLFRQFRLEISVEKFHCIRTTR